MINPDTAALRTALGQFATGVTIVTACSADGRLVGLTVNSFASVSLEPPLVLWSLGENSPSRSVFENCSHYAINVLTANQEALARQFAASGSDKFAGVKWKVGAGGTALLAGCSASFECRNEARYPGGDHIIFLGHVERHHRSHDAHTPLLYYAARYRQMEAAAKGS